MWQLPLVMTSALGHPANSRREVPCTFNIKIPQHLHAGTSCFKVAELHCHAWASFEISWDETRKDRERNQLTHLHNSAITPSASSCSEVWRRQQLRQWRLYAAAVEHWCLHTTESAATVVGANLVPQQRPSPLVAVHHKQVSTPRSNPACHYPIQVCCNTAVTPLDSTCRWLLKLSLQPQTPKHRWFRLPPAMVCV